MTRTVGLGFDGLTVEAGTHLCVLFRGAEERTKVMVPFMEEGLRAGDKCLCAFDAPDAETVRAEMSTHLDIAAAGDQLDVVWPHDVYLGRGAFSSDDTVAFWDEWAALAFDEGGYDFARVAGEMTWAVSEVIGSENLIRYESELNRFVPRYPQVMMCLYDLDRFGGQVLVELLRTHPKVMLGGTILENLYYVGPDEYLASRR